MQIKDLAEYFDTTLYEMSNFSSNTTGLPSNTKLWVREEPNELPHTKYRIKIIHPQKGSAVFAIWGDEPMQVEGDWQVSGKTLKYLTKLLKFTHNEIRAHIDGNDMDSADLGQAFTRAKQNIESRGI